MTEDEKGPGTPRRRNQVVPDPSNPVDAGGRLEVCKQLMTGDPVSFQGIIECLAAVEHERWSNWQTYLHSVCYSAPDGIDHIINPHSLIIPAKHVQRWDRQIHTRYEDLIDQEKESDRNEALVSFTFAATFFANWLLQKNRGLRLYLTADLLTAWHQEVLAPLKSANPKP